MKKIFLVLFLSVLLTGCNKAFNGGKDNFCKGCVFGTAEIHIGKEIPEGYSKDYSNLGNVFMGNIVEDGIVKRNFVCGIEQGKPFCFESINYPYNNASDNKKIYDANKEVMEKMFSEVKRNDSYNEIYAEGTDVKVSLSDYNWFRIENDDISCTTTNSSGYSFCLD